MDRVDSMTMLAPGDPAPPFALRDQHGKTVQLEDFRGRMLLVYFYPKADTPGCTTQSCAMRDAREDLRAGGVDVIGISPDEPTAQRAFDEKFGLGFPLLADTDHAVAEAWGTWGERSMYGNTYMGVIRSSFLVGPDGMLLETFYKVSPKDTVPKVQRALTEAGSLWLAPLANRRQASRARSLGDVVAASRPGSRRASTKARL